MPTKHDEEWREFYTEIGFRHGFALGAKMVRVAAERHLTADQLARIDTWLAQDVSHWTREVLSEGEPPTPPTL